MTNYQTLQALLYAHGGELKKRDLLSLLAIEHEGLDALVHELRSILAGQGLEVFETETTLSLRTAREYSAPIEALQKHDTHKDIGAASLEVLAIVLYSTHASRAHIDYMRGVNSSGTLRQLVLRGLLERTKATGDNRSWVYTATPELLAHIGIHSSDELPEHEALHKALSRTDATTTH